MIRVLTVLAVAVLTGCAIGTPKYSCPAPGHGVCKSITAVYEDQGDAPLEKGTSADAKHTNPPDGNHTAAPRFAPYPFTGVTPGAPLRREASVLRIWVAPWVDKYGDWNDQSYLYVLRDRGGWRVDESLRGLLPGKQAAGDTP